MGKISKHRAGLIFGCFLGALHFAWALLVAMKLAQPFMDWIFRLHFIHPPYTVTSFSFLTGIGLIIVTFLVGYVSGWLFGAILNWIYYPSNHQ